jgi:thiamine pyridinylase
MIRSGSRVSRHAATNVAVTLTLGLSIIVLSGLADAARCGAHGGSRCLRVVLYPYVPDYPGYVRQVATGFSNSPEGAKINVEFVDLTDGYYDPKSPGFVGGTQADIYEIDSVFLKDFVDRHKIRPLPQSVAPKHGEFLATAQRRGSLDCVVYGYPHWVCSNFVFYLKGDAAIASARTLADLERVLGSQDQTREPLLGDFKGKSTLGEFYLMSLFDRYGNWSAVENHLGGLEQSQANDVLRLAALCRKGYCHSKSRHDAAGTYGREFARGKGRVLVGYSEILYYVGAEEQLCEKTAACVSPDDLDVSLVPMDDRGVAPMVWVDSYVLSPSCTGQCEQDAVSFLRFVNSEKTQRLALTGSPPRYLLPARASLYADPAVLKSAPLYPKLKRLVENADAPTGPNLNGRLQEDGNTIDGRLPLPAQP